MPRKKDANPFGTSALQRNLPAAQNWLSKKLNSGHGPEWQSQVFEKMGEDPDSANYVRPADDDVWAFVNGIREWLMNANRSGMPV
jgi:hypothetical protein